MGDLRGRLFPGGAKNAAPETGVQSAPSNIPVAHTLDEFVADEAAVHGGAAPVGAPAPVTPASPTLAASKNHLIQMDKQHLYFGAGLLLVLGFLIGGYTASWIILYRNSGGGTAYTALSIPYAGGVGLAWTILLLLVAAAGWFARKRWLLAFGVVLCIPTIVVLVGIDLALHYTIHSLPLWLLPYSVRHYVPDVKTGWAPFCAAVSIVLLTMWFVVALIVELRRHHNNAKALRAQLA